MILCQSILKRILRDRMSLVTMLLLPVFLITVLVVLGGRSSARLPKVGLADLDRTELTRLVEERLAERAEVVHLEGGEGTEALLGAGIDYYLVLPSGFTEKLIAGENPLLESYSMGADASTVPLQLYLNNLVNGFKTISSAAAGDQGAFYRGVAVYLTGPFQFEKNPVNQSYTPLWMTQNSLGFLIMGMLFFSTMVSREILRDKRRKTLQRVLSAPVSLKQYMFEHLFGFLLLSQLQVICILALMGFGFGLSFGESFLRLYLVLLLFSTVCVALGIAITSLSRDAQQAGVLASALITPMAMLGGCFWPRELMPQVLQKISYFVPVTWMLEATNKVLYGGTLAEIRYEILLLLLFAIIFFLLGTWRKEELA